MSNILITAQNVRKSFNDGDLSVDVLKGIEFSIQKNQSIAIIGASGSGKSTLLHLLAGLDIPDSGNIFINKKSINELNNEERGQLRNECLGFIYQFDLLLPEFTAKENVAMPLLIRRCTKRTAYEKAEDILSEVGLSERMMHKPGELSGGERQRTAIARALVTNPSCILADEPTGNLDSKSGHEIMGILDGLHQKGNTIILVTHEDDIAQHAHRIIRLFDGKITEDIEKRKI